MVDFQLTPEQEAIRELAHKFAMNEIRPVAWELDREGTFPRELLKKAFDAGLMNANIPEEYGGGGLGVLEEVIVAEEIAYGCSGVATVLLTNNLGTTPVLVAGSEEQRRRILVPLCERRQIMPFCVTEPDAGSDVSAISTLAKDKGDYYLLTGNKTFITCGGVADLYSVLATTDRSRGYKGMVMLVVYRDWKGVSVGKKEDKLGNRCSDTAQVIFEDVEVPKDYRLGAEGEGFKIAMMTLDKFRPIIAAISVGIARAALEFAIDYAKRRIQFGKPIAEQPVVANMLANMAMDIEAARLLTYKSAWMLDRGLKPTLLSATAKCFASDVAMRVTTDAVQIYGGYGYSKEYPVEKLMRDAKLMQIFEGTNEIQRLVISREILRER